MNAAGPRVQPRHRLLRGRLAPLIGCNSTPSDWTFETPF